MASFGLGRPQEESAGTIAVEPSTPWIAASEGNIALLQSSLQSLNLKPTASDEHGYTLLHAAAAYGQLAIMEWLLLQQQVPVNAVDNDGDTALHQVERMEAAKVLVEIGKADPNVCNAEGKTALQCKQDDLSELMQEEDDDDDDVLNLRNLVVYLTFVTGQQ